MNNEEKILEMLTEMRSDIGQINGRLDRLEATQEEMQTTLTRVAVTQEGVVLPRLQLLYEGHDEIRKKLDTLAEKSRVDALEDDVAMLKDSVKLLRMEVAELKKVQ